MHSISFISSQSRKCDIFLFFQEALIEDFTPVEIQDSDWTQVPRELYYFINPPMAPFTNMV